jgi:hypothetical protein
VIAFTSVAVSDYCHASLSTSPSHPLIPCGLELLPFSSSLLHHPGSKKHSVTKKEQRYRIHCFPDERQISKLLFSSHCFLSVGTCIHAPILKPFFNSIVQFSDNMIFYFCVSLCKISLNWAEIIWQLQMWWMEWLQRLPRKQWGQKCCFTFQELTFSAIPLTLRLNASCMSLTPPGLETFK